MEVCRALPFLRFMLERLSFPSMSRRSRRRKGAGKSPWLGKLLFGMGAVLLLAVGFGYFGLRAYLHSEGFRKFLAAEVGRTAKIDCYFDPFRWDGLAVETSGFHATGSGLLAVVEADHIDTEIGFGGVGRGVWEVMATRISRLDIALDLSKKGEPVPAEQTEQNRKVVRKQPGWVPKKVEIASLDIDRKHGEDRYGGNCGKRHVPECKARHRQAIVQGRTRRWNCCFPVGLVARTPGGKDRGCLSGRKCIRDQGRC